MFRVLLGLLIASALHAAPAPKTIPAHFPTKQGDTLEYELQDGDRFRSSYTDVVTKVEQGDGGLRVTVTRDYPSLLPYIMIFTVSDRGVFRISDNGHVLEERVTLSRNPPQVGTKWEVGKTTYTITREEEVEVPAGKYKALRVEVETGGREGNKTLWLSAGVGLVRCCACSRSTRSPT
jgi:hypothetical protein